jgi:hypothetical protein
MTARTQFLRLLRRIAAEIEGLKDDEFDALLAGASDKRLVRAPGVKKPKSTRGLSQAEIAGVIAGLSATSSREDARALLTNDDAINTRANLERIARALGVHVNKHDTRIALLDKVVEAAIGVRLRSEAIRGLNLKGSGSHDGE